MKNGSLMWEWEGQLSALKSKLMVEITSFCKVTHVTLSLMLSICKPNNPFNSYPLQSPQYWNSTIQGAMENLMLCASIIKPNRVQKVVLYNYVLFYIVMSINCFVNQTHHWLTRLTNIFFYGWCLFFINPILILNYFTAIIVDILTPKLLCLLFVNKY